MDPAAQSPSRAPAGGRNRPARPGPELRVIEGGDGPDEDEGGGAGAPTDADLLAEFHAGREEAFSELVRRHQAAVRAVVRRYAEHADDVLDLAQRAFLRALEASRRAPVLGLWRTQPFHALLLRTAVNLGKNHARDARRWRRAPLEALDGFGSGALEATGTARLERLDRQRMLREAVLQLPRRQREVLTLRIDAELSFAEIARVLDTSENNAKVHFHHASRRLARLVAGAERGPEESGS
jgi:RNA polymerase sigma-70 factor (ECF subfamily)